MLRARIPKLFLATLLLSSPILIPQLARLFRIEAILASAAGPVESNPLPVISINDSLHSSQIARIASNYSQEEVSANHEVENLNLLLWSISFIGLSALVRWFVGPRQRRQTNTTK